MIRGVLLLLSLIVVILVRPASPLTTVRAAQTDTVSVEIAAVPPATVGGFAVLTSTATGTEIQVLALGAEPGTTVIVHRGTCDAIDPAPVALLGDIGAPVVAGQLSKTIPQSLTELGSGYLIAFHSGLDFSSAIACGVIPSSGGAAPVPTGSAPPSDGGVEGNGYTSPTYGYVLTWDSAWQVEAESSENGADVLILSSDDGGSVTLIGHEGYGGDARACLTGWSAFIQQRQQASELTALEPYADPSGAPVTGGDGERAWDTVQYNLQSRVALPMATVHYHECRRLSATAVLEIDHLAPPAAYAAAATARDDLLSALVIPPTEGRVATAVPTQAAPTALPEPPEPTAVPSPTVDAACAGVPEWYAAATAELKPFNDLLVELGKAEQRGDVNKAYLIYLDLIDEIDRLVPALDDLSTPPSAADLAQELVEGLRRYQDAVARYVAALNDALSVTQAQIQGIITDWNEAFVELGRIGRRIQDLAKGCGVDVDG